VQGRGGEREWIPGDGNQMTAPDHLIFLHIPKTAGSSLYSVIQRQYPPGQMYVIAKVSETEKFRVLPEQKRNSVRMLMGHLPFGTHGAFTEGATEYFTLLREPVDRVMSNYFHIYSDPAHHFHRQLHAKKYTLCQLLETGKILNLNNCMTRFLSGDAKRKYDECDHAMLEKALVNLSAFALVGLQENFELFLVRLMERYRWKNPYHFKKRISTARIAVHDVDKITRGCVEHYNKLDIELYRIMQERVLNEQSRLSAGLLRRAARLKKLNDLLNRMGNAVRGRRAVKRMACGRPAA
jgi:Sulfotransferase family